MAAGVFSKVVHFTTPTSTGNFDITDAGITDTPKLVIIVGGASGGSETIDARMMIGAYDGTDQFFTALWSQDNQLSANAERRRNTGQILRNAESTAFLAAAATTFLSNGVRLNFATASVARNYMAIFFWGDDFEAKIGSVAYGTGTSAIATTGVGFQPNALMFASVGQGGANTTIGIGAFTLGMAVDNSGGVQQRGFFYFSPDPRGAGPGPSTLIDDTACNGEIYASNNPGDANPGLNIVFNSFDADGFTVTPSASSSNVTGYYIAMRFNGREVALANLASPTSTGTVGVSPGFAPQMCFGVSTRLPSFNSLVELATDASNWGVFAADEAGVQGSQSLAERYNTDPSITSEWMDTANAIRIGSVSDPGIQTSPLVVAEAVFTSGGIDFDFTTVDASARQSWLFMVEGNGGPGATYVSRRFFM